MKRLCVSPSESTTQTLNPCSQIRPSSAGSFAALSWLQLGGFTLSLRPRHRSLGSSEAITAHCGMRSLGTCGIKSGNLFTQCLQKVCSKSAVWLL